MVLVAVDLNDPPVEMIICIINHLHANREESRQWKLGVFTHVQITVTLPLQLAMLLLGADGEEESLLFAYLIRSFIIRNETHFKFK